MIGSFFYGLAHVTDVIFNLLTLVLILSMALSWFDVSPDNRYARWIRTASEMLCSPVRRWTASWRGPFDFAPMLVMLLIVFLQKSIPVYLMRISLQLQP